MELTFHDSTRCVLKSALLRSSRVVNSAAMPPDVYARISARVVFIRPRNSPAKVIISLLPASRSVEGVGGFAELGSCGGVTVRVPGGDGLDEGMMGWVRA